MERGEILKKYYDLGFDIIRLKPNDKRPVETWGEPRNYSFNQLNKWHGNFGVALGSRSNNIVVVDLDQPELYDYFQHIETLTIKTPNKGYHLYFESQKPQKKIPSYLFKPIDLQGEGSYVVAPPSSINGKEYEIIKDVPIMRVNDVEKFTHDLLQEITFKKVVDCRDLAREFMGEPSTDSGHYLLYNCPFHPDDTPSMAVYEDGMKCFGCGWYGDAQAFLKRYKNMDYGEIHEYLDRNGVVLEREDEWRIQSKKQKELMNLTEYIKSKFEMCTDVITGNVYLYYPDRNVWKDIGVEAFFFRQLLSEELGFVPLQDDLEIIKQYVLNPRREDESWIGFNNGLVNAETGEFRNPTPDIFTTTWLNYNYDPDSYSEFMESVLRDVLCDSEEGDKKYQFFFEMVGYLFTDHNRYNKMFFLTGSGGNGKSTIMGIIRKIFEGYTTAVPLQDLSKPFGLQPLLNKKVNIVYDLSSKAIKDMGVIKAITGEDEVAIDRKYETTVTTKLGTKILATGNVLPRVSEETFAFFRRVVHLELKNTFKPDQSIPVRIQSDVKGIEWVIYKSIQAYQNVKVNGWSIDENIKTVANSYIKLSDPLGWACDRIFEEGDVEDFLTREQIIKAMEEELRDNEMAVPRKKAQFYEAIREFGGEDSRKSHNGAQKRGFICIKFKYQTPELLDLKGWG